MAQTDRRTGLVGYSGMKIPVRVATTAAITLSGEQTIDGVACVTGDRVLVKDQASSIDNGIYEVDTGDWNRSADCDGPYDLVQGSVLYANAGSTNTGFWYCTSADDIDIGTDNITWARASSVLATVSAYMQTMLDDATAAEARTTLGSGATGDALFLAATAASARSTLGLGTMAVENVSAFPGRNALINGAFNVAQRGTSFTSVTTPANNDDTYLLDRWALLSDGNDIVDVTQNTTTVPTGSLYSCALDVETANKKFGVIQFIEQKDAQRLIGGTASLSFKARKGAANATVNTMRAVVLAWDGTADTVTSDVVSAWGASGVNPTLVANWTAENVAADLTLTDSFQTFSIEGISIDTVSAKNIAVFLYYNDADGTVGDFIYVTDVQLEAESAASEFDRRAIGIELPLCQRYYWKTPGSGYDFSYPSALSGSVTDAVRFAISHPLPMRTTPTVTILGQSQVDRANSNLVVNSGSDYMHLILEGDVAAGSGAAGWTSFTMEASAEL